MHAFHDYLYQQFAELMHSWPPEAARDICLLVCTVGFDEDDARRGIVSLTATTPEFWEATLTGPYASSGDEPGKKWYTAGMTPFEGITVCIDSEEWNEWTGEDGPVDKEGLALRDDYFKSLDLLITDEDYDRLGLLWSKQWKARNGQGTITAEEEVFLQELSQRLEAVSAAFIDTVAETIRRLFTGGVVTEVCGKPVPAIFPLSNDGDESYLLTRMREVNPPGLTEEYYQWRKHRGG